MHPGKTKLTLALILAEACCIYPLYGLVLFSLGYVPTVPSWFFPVMAAAATLANLKLKMGGGRNLVLFLANLLLLGLAVSAANLLQPRGLFDSVILNLLLLWVFFRSLYLVWKGRIDIYLHFDAGLAVIFLLTLLIAVAQAPLAQGLFWLAASYVFNILSVSLAQSGEKDEGSIPWLGAGIITVLMVPLFLLARSLFPYLFEPARFLYDLGSSALMLFANFLALFLKGYFMFNANKETASQQAADTAFAENPAAAAPGSPFFAFMAKFTTWLMIILAVVLFVLLCGYLIRLFLNWLLKRPVRPSYQARRQSMFSWRWLLGSLKLLGDTVKMLLLPWLPVTISTIQAYRALLKWGVYRNFPRRGCETPFEYLNRLKERFPRYQQELTAITASFVACKYGPSTNNVASRDLKNSLRRLYLPGAFTGSRITS